MLAGEAIAGNASTSKPQQNTPVFKHVIETREISLSSSASAQTLLTDEAILNTSRNRLSSSATSSASAIFIGHSEDLLTQIFLCLPPKSLLRFQGVSKQWLSIISNSDFRRLHCRKFPTCCLSSNAAALFLFRRKINQTSELNFISFGGDDVTPMGTVTSRLRDFLSGENMGLHSCNGLLCIDFNLNYRHREFIVYNPTTGHYRLIPKCKVAEERHLFPSSIDISFDPLKSDHYKLVCLWVEDEEDVYHFFVYSSETGIWRRVEETMDLTDEPYYVGSYGIIEPFYFGNGILWNGNLHWVSRRRKSVLCFDLDNECHNWSVPSLPMRGNDHWYFGESGGCLCYIEVNHSQPMFFDVFALEKDYSKWFLKFSIDLNPLTILYPSMLAIEYYPRFHFPCFLVSEKEKKSKIVISLVGKFILYDINDRTVKELVDVEPVDPYYCWMDMFNWYQAFTFTETLASV